MRGELIVYKSPEILADKVSDLLMEAVAQSTTEQYHLAISGGSTPNILFTALAKKYPQSALWQKTHFWWVDERMVLPENPESNFGVARKLLFSQIDIPEKNVHPIRGEEDPFQECGRYARQIKDALTLKDGWPYFDLIFLGLGEDGHTASIFPNQLQRIGSDEICEVAQHPVSGQYRITLTAKLINHAATIGFLVTGSNKSERLSEIWSNDKKATQLPASFIHPENGKLYWLTDEQAATQH